MGLLEKLKNTFFEEEIVEVEESPKKIKNDKGPKEKERRIKKEIVEEEKLEVICNVEDVKRVVAELRKVHPYEEPAIDIVPLLSESDF